VAEQDVDNNGVMTDHETGDPSVDMDAPDPALGEAPRSGALSIGSKTDQQSRAGRAREGLESLQGQYGAVQKGLEGAYGAQTKALQAARDKLLATPMGPSAQEQAYRRAAAFTQTPGFNPGDVSNANANNMEAVRNAELQKQQLAAQYGIQGAQAQIGQYGAMGNSLIQRMRIAQSDVNNSSTQANKAPAKLDKYWTQDPSDPTKFVDHPEMRAADEQQTMVNAQNTAKAKLAAQQYAATGLVSPEMIDLAKNDMKSLPSAVLRNPAAMSQILHAVHDDAVASGDAGKSFWAEQQVNKESGKVLDDYTKGKTHAQLDGLNTAVQHINVLKPVIDSLGNGQVPVLNYIGNTWNQQVLGKPAPTDYNGIRDFVVGEISKAVLPGGGGEAERMALAKSASQSNSGSALKSIVEKWQELLAGKTKFTKFNWDNATRGRYGSFESRFLLPDTQRALGVAPQAAAPAQRPGQGNPLVQQYLPGGQFYKAPQAAQ